MDEPQLSNGDATAKAHLDLGTILGRGANVPARLRGEEQSVLDLVDGRRSIEEIVRLSGLSGFVVMRTVRSLIERGVVEPSGPSGTLVREVRDTERGVGPAPSRTMDLTGDIKLLKLIKRKTTQKTKSPFEETSEDLKTGEESLPVPAASGSTKKEAAPEASEGLSVFKLGRYEVLLRLARGSMGSVYLCRRAGAWRFERLFLLKVVRQYCDQTDEAVRSLLREARIGTLLTHPHIVNVQDVGSYEGQPFLVLDYVEGCSLADLLAAVATPPPGVIVSIMLDVLAALSWAHQQKDENGEPLDLVHADVSPSNIIIGVDGSARLADFGSAWCKGDPFEKERTVVAGKPAYSAPERFTREGLDGRTDLFSMGVVLWNALTGRQLFAAEGVEQTIVNVLQQRVDPPSVYGAPAPLNDICLRALTRARNGRYRNADEMRTTLLRAAQTNGLLATRAEVGAFVAQVAREPLDERRRRVAQSRARATAEEAVARDTKRNGKAVAAEPGATADAAPTEVVVKRREPITALMNPLTSGVPLWALPVVAVIAASMAVTITLLAR